MFVACKIRTNTPRADPQFFQWIFINISTGKVPVEPFPQKSAVLFFPADLFKPIEVTPYE